MSPEERSEMEARFGRIERALEFVAQNQAQFSADLARLTEKMERLEDVTMKTADAVASLVRLFERHLNEDGD